MSHSNVTATILCQREWTRRFIDVRNTRTCYTRPVTTGKRGPSYAFWLRVQQELNDRGMSTRELVERSGVQHTVIASLQHSSIRDRARRRSNVLAIAEVFGIPEVEALQLAGFTATPTDPNVDVRESIRKSADLDDDQKQALYQLLDVFAKGRERHQERRDLG